MKENPNISEAEWKVMKVVWKQYPITTNQVVEQLLPSNDWKPKTIMTLLKRLVNKGALSFEKKGRAYSYSPLVREKDCIREESRSFLERVFGGSLKPMLAHFLEEEEMDRDDIDELKRILNERSREK